MPPFPAKKMRAITVIHKSEVSKGFSPISRNRLSLLGRLFFYRAKCETDSGIDALSSSRGTHPSLVAAEKEAKAVLTVFLRKQGFSNAVALKTIKKSDLFVNHLVSRLHSVDESRYIIGQEFAVIKIRDALTAYLENLLKEHGNMLVELVQNFPNPPAKEKPDVPISPFRSTLNSVKQKAVSRVSEVGPSGKLSPTTVYLIELGMDLDQIKRMASRWPKFSYCSLEGKIKPLIEFLLNLGASKSDVGSILIKFPSLCSLSLRENIIPTMTFLENFGVGKNQWVKVLRRFPQILSYSKPKIMMTVDFLVEMGLSDQSIGKVITYCPSAIGCNVERNLRPKVEYFRSLGIDVAALLHRYPMTLILSIDGNLKPVTEFFLERGYNIEEVAGMISRFGSLCSNSLTANLIPKWRFFLTMNYPKEALIRFPQYFGYSLEGRIKPRYALATESGVRFTLSVMLTLTNCKFEKALRKKKSENMLCSKQ